MFPVDGMRAGRTPVLLSADSSDEITTTSEPMSCRSGCGACCIAPSISSPIPGMPHGKPTGVRCIQLSRELQCDVFGMPGRPAVCLSYQASASCGTNRDEALRIWEDLETMTGS